MLDTVKTYIAEYQNDKTTFIELYNSYLSELQDRSLQQEVSDVLKLGDVNAVQTAVSDLYNMILI
jgi:hypothetical protein